MPVTSVSKAARYRRAASVIFPMPPYNEKRAGTTPALSSYSPRHAAAGSVGRSFAFNTLCAGVAAPQKALVAPQKAFALAAPQNAVEAAAPQNALSAAAPQNAFSAVAPQKALPSPSRS